MVRIAKRKIIHPRQAAAKGDREIEPLAYSIAEFAALHGISIDLYFRLQRLGLGPCTMKAGARTLISFEAAEMWRRSREDASAASKHAANP